MGMEERGCVNFVNMRRYRRKTVPVATQLPAPLSPHHLCCLNNQTLFRSTCLYHHHHYYSICCIYLSLIARACRTRTFIRVLFHYSPNEITSVKKFHLFISPERRKYNLRTVVTNNRVSLGGRFSCPFSLSLTTSTHNAIPFFNCLCSFFRFPFTSIPPPLFLADFLMQFRLFIVQSESTDGCWLKPSVVFITTLFIVHSNTSSCSCHNVFIFPFRT